jgi:hypothetical protein
MKDTLPYFSHDNNARHHPKMKALIAEYGREGYGNFWILNEIIAETSGAFIDISRKINKLNLANELGLDSNELDKFLSFLSDPEIDLINIKDKKITTDRVSELFKQTMENRETERDKKKKKKENTDFPQENEDFPKENTDFPQEKHTDKTKQNKTRQNSSCSDEPPNNSISKSLKLAELLLTSHRKEFPNYLSGKEDSEVIKKWAQEIEKLIRIDEKSPEIIREVILWIKTPGNFWFPNILSGTKLRKHFEQIYTQMTAKKTSSDPPKQKVVIYPTYEETENLLIDIETNMNKADNSLKLSDAYKKMVREKGNVQ